MSVGSACVQMYRCTDALLAGQHHATACAHPAPAHLPPPADEPTSGLDSTASKALVAALHTIARSGVTAAAVVHQPSWPCCQLFDDLLLLGTGGRTGALFLGGWLASTGLPCSLVHALMPRPSWGLSPHLSSSILRAAVYYGEVSGAQPYFEGLGYQLPLHQVRRRECVQQHLSQRLEAAMPRLRLCCCRSSA